MKTRVKRSKLGLPPHHRSEIRAVSLHTRDRAAGLVALGEGTLRAFAAPSRFAVCATWSQACREQFAPLVVAAGVFRVATRVHRVGASGRDIPRLDAFADAGGGGFVEPEHIPPAVPVHVRDRRPRIALALRERQAIRAPAHAATLNQPPAHGLPTARCVFLLLVLQHAGADHLWHDDVGWDCPRPGAR